MEGPKRHYLKCHVKCPLNLVTSNNECYEKTIEKGRIRKDKLLLKFYLDHKIKLINLKRGHNFTAGAESGLTVSQEQKKCEWNIQRRAVIVFHWELFYCFWFELIRSRVFQTSFVCWLLHRIESEQELNRKHENDETSLNCSLLKSVHLTKNYDEIILNRDKLINDFDMEIDVFTSEEANVRNLVLELKWSYILLPIFLQHISLNYILACLSTLGGAYSSLGEHSKSCAKIAGSISMKQLKVAVKIGNPVLASHCWLYYAHSLMQIGKLNSASNIIQQEHRRANSGKSDPKLLLCCKAAWVKLKYLQKKRLKERNRTK